MFEGGPRPSPISAERKSAEPLADLAFAAWSHEETKNVILESRMIDKSKGFPSMVHYEQRFATVVSDPR